jgi:stalled ribosome alternative rescue factor ArfA
MAQQQNVHEVSNRKAMMVVLNLPCFSRNRCSEGKKGAKAYSRKEKHPGRRDW